MQCGSCGTELPRGAAHCPSCGTITPNRVSESGISPDDFTAKPLSHVAARQTPVPTDYGSPPDGLLINPYEQHLYSLPKPPPPPRRQVNIGFVIIITAVIVAFLEGGVLYAGHVFSFGSNPSTVRATPTATITSSSTEYTTSKPGKDCDTSGGTWVSADSRTQCTSNGTIITKTLNGTPNFGGWGEQRFQLLGYPFPTDYSVKVTISAITDLGGGSGCAGISVHRNQAGTFADTLQVCSNGGIGVDTVQDGRELQTKGGSTSTSTDYLLIAHITPDTIILTVNNGVPLSIPALSSTTSFISLNVFWQNAGAHALFTNFQYMKTP